MEIIQLSGYTEFEKLNIARAATWCRARRANAASSDVDARRSPRTRSARSIHHYTREAGVRSLEREIASICRKVALRGGEARARSRRSRSRRADVPKYLGVPQLPRWARRTRPTRSA